MSITIYREIKCDRCQVVVRDALTGNGKVLPSGWGSISAPMVAGSTEIISTEAIYFCPECVAIVQEAMRPRERVRRHAERPDE